MKNNKNEKRKVVLGMSGGVDSSVAAFLLKQQGLEVVGVAFRFGVWENEKNLLKENVCCSSGAFLIAKQVCLSLKIPFMTVDVKDDFLKKVVAYWKKEISSCYTPNPCMICNHKVKIQALIDYAKEIGADYVSTGHYAKNILNKKEKEFELREAKDKKKNQVYFLSQLSQSQLKKLKLPLGNYVKEEVYEIAKKQGFKVFRKQKQSQDFCFVANKSYNYLIESELGKKPGKIIDEKGNILGDHQGLYYYTIGQRKGINLPQGPFYVKEKDLKNNRLVVVKDKKELLAKDILVKEIKWINSFDEKKLLNKKVLVQIRYADKKSQGIIKEIQGKKIKIKLSSFKQAITPGQFAVLYEGSRCLGGGKIIN